MFLHLSRSGKMLVGVDRSGRVVARRLEIQQGPRVMEHAFVMDKKAAEVVEEIQVTADDTKILVSMSHKDEIWDLETTNTLGEFPRSTDRTHWRWAQTSKQSMPLIYFSNGRATPYSWDIDRLGPSMDLCLAELGTTPIAAVTSSANASYLCILLAGSRPGLLPPIMRVWSIDEMHAVYRDSEEANHQGVSTQETTFPKVPANAIYDQLARDVKLIIGVYEHSLVFLTHQGWICSFIITSPRADTNYIRHFFIPFRYHNSASSLII